MDPDKGLWAFNRISIEGRTWKRYRGGMASDIWAGNPDRADFRKVTEFAGTNAYPMWHGGRIYFLSDQGGTANLWSIRPDGSDRRRHTDLGKWDARTPAMGPEGRIVFTLAADIHLFDPGTGEARKIDIALPSDRILTRSRYPDAAQYLSWFDLAPDGDRVAVVTRGEIFSVPVKKGVTLPVTRRSGAREDRASFGPEGKRIVYLTDESREQEIRTIDAWGRGEPQRVKPAGENGWHFPPIYSPDGRWIAYADQTQSLFVIPAEGGGKPTLVDRSGQAEIRDYTWSPDGRWLAYRKPAPTDYSSIFLFDTKAGTIHRVTGGTTNDRSPAWDPEGRYLYFLSDRFTNPLLGGQDWDNVDYRATKPFLVLLRKDVKNPLADLAGLPPEEGEEGEEKEKTDKEDKKEEKGDGEDGKKEKKPPEPVEIDLEGLPDRVAAFPVDRGNLYGLAATAKKVFYLSEPIKGMAEEPGLFEEPPPEATLVAFDLEKKKAETFLDGVSGYALAPAAGKIAVMKKRGEIYVLGTDAPPGPDKLGEAKLDLDGLVVELDPREEWEQIYYQAWRDMRDFYWDAGHAGVDWKGMRDQYATLLPRLSIRDDLRDLLGELIGELATSHTYVWGGDPGRQVSQVQTGLLGADFVREGDTFRVERIYRGDPADNVRSPLDEPGVSVREGEYILAVNHLPFRPGRPFEASLEGLAGKRALLTVKGRPDREGAREVVVVPLRSEEDLRYADWVRRNREYVAEKTGGRIGYLHIPDMWTDGLVRFNTWFYPQLDKEGMIVDVRWNGGGAVSQMILERFRREILSFDRARAGGTSTYPYRTLNGPFVVLTNEFAGSDGDIFPRAVQLSGLAPVIGKRSWGGVVGIRGDKMLVDRGMVTQPEFAWWEPGAGWSIENHGVDPDIEVQNLPQDLVRGVDSQLDRGIEEVLRLHRERPPIRPEFGPVRPKSREAFRDEL